MKKRYVVEFAETGDVIDYFNTMEEAEKAVAEYEAEDDDDDYDNERHPERREIYNYRDEYEIRVEDYSERPLQTLLHDVGLTDKAFSECYDVPESALTEWKKAEKEGCGVKYIAEVLQVLIDDSHELYQLQKKETFQTKYDVLVSRVKFEGELGTYGGTKSVKATKDGWRIHEENGIFRVSNDDLKNREECTVSLRSLED